MARWRKGDTLVLTGYTCEPGKGLSYPPCQVRAAEEGASGGWDVYDGDLLPIDRSNPEPGDFSFYGFSVVRVIRTGRKR